MARMDRVLEWMATMTVFAIYGSTLAVMLYTIV